MKTNVEPLKLTSPEPISDGGRKYNSIYFVIGLIAGIGGFLSNGFTGALFGALFFGGLGGYTIKEAILDLKLKQLRKTDFAMDEQIAYEELIEKLIPILLPLNMTIEKDKNGQPVITYQKLIYDVIYNSNGTFSIWWRKSLLRAFGAQSKTSTYRKVVVAMGIIGFNVQKVTAKKIDSTEETK